MINVLVCVCVCVCVCVLMSVCCLWDQTPCTVCAVPPLPILRVRNLHRAPTPRGGGTIPVAQKKKTWRAIPASVPVTARGWMQMIIIDGQLCLWKDIRNPEPRKTKKRWRPYCLRHFQIGYIHNPVKLFWVLSSGATDHKTHGSDHTTNFESRIGSFFGSAKKSCVNY